MANTAENSYICINCGAEVHELFKKYSNSVKTVHCEKCHKVADKYIEFESVIILVDAMLLSQQAFRHMLYNRDFRLHWKLSLVLLLLESFALWRERSSDTIQYDLVHEKGFYFCCLENLCDYMVTTIFLLLITLSHSYKAVLQRGLVRYTLTLLKANTIANFSKFFLLPIMVWRQNTTELGAYIHYLLVTGHHVFSLISVYAVVVNLTRIQGAFLILPAYFIKEYWKIWLSAYAEEHL